MSTRRAFLATMSSTGLLTAARVAEGEASRTKIAASRQAGRRNFVLVHGAFHGGWCYARVADILRARGHRVFTPTLTGLGERSHLAHAAVNCSTHVLDVVNTIKWEQLHDVILCGHSYGGMVIGGVADIIPDRIASLVYLDAIVPESGKSLLDGVSPKMTADLLSSAADHEGYLLPPLPAAFFNINSADQAMVDSLCTAQPIATFCERLKLTGAYICEENLYSSGQLEMGRACSCIGQK